MAIQKAKPFPTFALPFKQPPGPVGAQPMRGSITHPPMAGKNKEAKVPQHQRTSVTQVNKPDYKPSATNAKRTQEKSVAGPNMGQSDINSEAIGSSMGPASLTSAPAAFKTKTVKSKQMPFYGSMK